MMEKYKKFLDEEGCYGLMKPINLHAIIQKEKEELLNDLQEALKPFYESAKIVWSAPNQEHDNKIYAMGQSDMIAKLLSERSGEIFKKLYYKHLSPIHTNSTPSESVH